MDEEEFKQKLCKGVKEIQDVDDFQKVERVLAPFLRTLRKRKFTRVDVISEENKELYLKRRPKDVLTRLQDYFVDPLHFTTLMNETAELLRVVTNSKGVNLYLTDYNRQEVMLCPKFHSKRFIKKYPIETGTYVAAHVAFTKEYVYSNDILGDVRFPGGIPEISHLARSVICIPVITNVQENCIGIIELYRDCFKRPYDLVNLQICTALTAWMGIAMDLNTTKSLMLKESEIQMLLANLAQMYFSKSIPFGKVVSELLTITKAAVNAERGGFYVFRSVVPPNTDETLFADVYEEGFDENKETTLFKKRTKTRYQAVETLGRPRDELAVSKGHPYALTCFVKNGPGIPGYVARSGKLINLADAYKDSRFDKRTDSLFQRTRSLLAFPVKNSNGVLAVIKVINSLEYPFFRQTDIDMMMSFSNYIALLCEHFHLETSHSKNELRILETNKLLDFHTKCSPEDIVTLRNFIQTEHDLPLGFFRFDWEIEEDSFKYIVSAIFKFDQFESLFDSQHFVDFFLRVKKSYRSVPYHNFDHALSVLHCAFLIITKYQDVYNSVEVTSILLAALCHDIDHQGFTNSFLTLRNDSLYMLYGECCGEAHCFEFTMFLIQSSDLLGNISTQSYQTIAKSLKKLILGFDLSIHFEHRIKVIEALKSRTFDWDNPEHREWSQNMILVCSDWSGSFVSLESSRKFVTNFYKETFRQGDMEKSMGFSPLPMMDRNKVECVEENQVILLTTVVLPCVVVVGELFPNLYEFYDSLNITLNNWKELYALRGQEMWKIHQALVKEKKDKKIAHKMNLNSNFSLQTFWSDKS